MEFFKKILIGSWKCWVYFLTAILVIIIGVFWTYPLSLSAKTFPLAYKGIRLWAWLIFYGSGFRLDLEKVKELEKKQSYIFIANHSSVIDIMVMALIHKNHPVVFIGKEELTRIPIFGTIYKRICIVVNRKDMKSRTHVYQLAKERIQHGNSLIIFPEGGIPDDTSIILDHFKDGPFTIGISTQTPIAVYTIKGLKNMFPDEFFEGYPGKVTVKLLDIIHVKNLTLADKKEIKEKSFRMMFSDLMKD